MWREIRLLATSIPVIASMSDVAASGGYYMAMAVGTVVAENLTLTGSIGVVTGKFNLGNLYEKMGFNKEIISRGKYAELPAAEQRPFRPDEADLFAKSAEYAYKLFRDKATYSRSMPVDKMEDNAQGRVWTGTDAACHGLIDAIGGMSRAVAQGRRKLQAITMGTHGNSFWIQAFFLKPQGSGNGGHWPCSARASKLHVHGSLFGVGKIELAQALSAFIFISGNARVQIDMSEYLLEKRGSFWTFLLLNLEDKPAFTENQSTMQANS
ncbi:hypothetical protein Nepgr_025833 [Nepenthes gracilis]|uniref:Peptidase S49 domain-containing protein n=1 Tax=Nepenthes gracilis TaxID=150966 RepID=A0AAD3T5Q6_NEPGR|nr:hypothetical protein Nepgr_025833 [Nepenthes gracilis]